MARPGKDAGETVSPKCARLGYPVDVRGMMAEDAGRRGGLLALAAAFVVVVGITAGDARAQNRPGFRMEYERDPGAESCPDAAQLRARVAELVGEDPFAADGEHEVVCRVSRQGGRLTAEIEVRYADSESRTRRVIESAAGECGELADNAALVIAMAVNPFAARISELAMRTGPSRAVQAVDTEIPGHGWDRARVARPLLRPPARSRETTGFARAAAGAALREGETLGARLVVGAGIRRGRRSAALEIMLDTADRVSGPAGGELTTRMGAATLVACTRGHGVGICGLGSVGWIRARGTGLADAQDSTTPHIRVGARLSGEVRLAPRLAFELFFDLLAAVSRTRLYIDDTPVWESPLGSLAVGVATSVDLL